MGFHVQVEVPGLLARYQHSANAINFGPKVTEVTIFGGWDGLRLADTTVLRFSEFSLSLPHTILGLYNM